MLSHRMPAGDQGTEQRPIVFRGTRLIHGTGRAPVEDSVLVVEGSKVLAVGTAGSVKISQRAEMCDVSGKTIIRLLTALVGPCRNDIKNK